MIREQVIVTEAIETSVMLIILTAYEAKLPQRVL